MNPGDCIYPEGQIPGTVSQEPEGKAEQKAMGRGMTGEN